MTARTVIGLLTFFLFLGGLTRASDPLACKIDLVKPEKDTLILTSGKTVLPPIKIGENVKFVVRGKDGKETEFTSLAVPLAVGDPTGDKVTGDKVEVYFRDEGKRKIVDHVTLIKEMSREEPKRRP